MRAVTYVAACFATLLPVTAPTAAAPSRFPARPAARKAPTALRATPKPKAAPAAEKLKTLIVSPASVTLDGEGAAHSLLVTGVPAAGPPRDLSATAAYASTNPKVVRVDQDGRLTIAGNGTAAVEVRAGGQVAKVTVRAANAATQRPLTFTNEIAPLLARTGCYQAACHAKQGGKNGFQLSVLAFDLERDYDAVVRQGHGRRINRLEPEKSLLLAKATLTTPHGGGMRFKVGSPEYQQLTRWIAEGAPYRQESDPVLARIEVEPAERVMEPQRRQRLLATAVYSDGSRRDVTALAQYASNESGIAEVGEDGVVRSTPLAGEAAVMVRYMGQVAVARVTVPQPNGAKPADYAGLPRQNFVDDLVYRKLSQLNLLPSELCDDATFLRRVYLDLIGTPPTAEETKAFLSECAAEVGVAHHGDTETRRGEEREKGEVKEPPATLREQSPPLSKGGPGGVSPNPETSAKNVARGTPPHRPLLREGVAAAKADAAPVSALPAVAPALKARAALVERLLQRPEYADYWGMRWVNLLMVNPDLLLPRGAFIFDWWVRDAFRSNMPYDRFAREIVTASGETYREGPPNFYRALDTPPAAGKAVSQLFLGVRLDCAQCHHHPFERWGQDDFYSFAAYFARVKNKSSYPEGYHSIIYAGTDGEVKHPKTDAVMPPRPLGAAAAEASDDEDRREQLARWMTAPENPYFGRTIVNRMWAMLMGRGIVEPVDDFRVTNPGSNDALLDALTRDFVAHGYDLKHLLRTITASAAYQRSSRVTPNNAKDTRNYSHFYTRRMPAEVLLDAIGTVTGVPQTFRGHPEGTRAIRMWDSRLDVEFLEVFGRPVRQSVCECERTSDGSVTQMLHLMNSGSVQQRLTADNGTVAALDKSGAPPEEIVERLYLTYYSRRPTDEERQAALGAFTREKTTRRAAIEDLEWALLNSAEFLLNH